MPSLAAHLVRRQDLEGSHDLFSSVSLGSLSGHEVDEGLEGDHACVVGVDQCHDAGKLHLTLRRRRDQRAWDPRENILTIKPRINTLLS